MKTQLASLSSNQSNSSLEIDAIRRRAEDSESEKRALMSVMDRMKEEDKMRDGALLLHNHPKAS